MKTFRFKLFTALLSFFLFFSLPTIAQNRNNGGSNHRGKNTTQTPSRNSRTPQTNSDYKNSVKSNSNSVKKVEKRVTPEVRPQENKSRNNTTPRQGSGNHQSTDNKRRPTGNINAADNNRQGFGNINSADNKRAETSNRGMAKDKHPGNTPPPSGNVNKGQGRPGMQPNHGQGSVSTPPPPSYRPTAVRPHTNFMQPGYIPPRPNGGFWAAPPPNRFRPVFLAPPPPPRPRVYVNYRIPTLSNILGLAFGTFIDIGINSLFNAGYKVLGYDNNIIYLSNVNELGYMWPEVSVYYTDGLMSDTQFQYWTPAPLRDRYNNVYRQLVRVYGQPIESIYSGPVLSTTWWAGGNTGYITLQYGPGTSQNGLTNYYTTLTYSDYR